MSFIDLALFSAGSIISCLGVTFLVGEIALTIKEGKLQRLRQQPNHLQQTVNDETDKLIDLINRIGTDQDLQKIVNECSKLKDPDITTQYTREITTLVLTRLFTKACDDELRGYIISTIIDLEMADDKKQIALNLVENAQTKENNGFIQLIESINQRLGGIKLK